MTEPKPTHHHLSIWFLIGLLLSVYGVLILGSGINQLWHPPSPPVAMESLHLGIWWGAGLLLIGLAYVVLFNPARQRRRAEARAALARKRGQTPTPAGVHGPIPESLPPVAAQESKDE